MRKENLIWILSVLLLSLFLVACGGEQAKPATEQDNQGETNENSKEDESEASETKRAISVHGDTINSAQVEDAVCVVNSRFEKGQMLVFRAEVKDVIADKAIEDAKVKVVLETGDEFEMDYGPHGEKETMLYTLPWTIPGDYVTGTINYQIVAEVDGEEYTFEPFDVDLSKLTIIDPS